MGPGEGLAALNGGAGVFLSGGRSAAGGGDERAFAGVGGENPVVPSEVHPRLGHQGGQARHEVERMQDHMCRTVAPRSFHSIPDVSLGGEVKAAFSE